MAASASKPMSLVEAAKGGTINHHNPIRYTCQQTVPCIYIACAFETQNYITLVEYEA